jgi:hypothetical protein
MVMLSLPAMLSPDAAQAGDQIRLDRAVARSWGLHRIALIQAAQGDITGALNTIAQIDDPDVIRGAGDVTGVGFFDGIPLYDHAPAAPDSGIFNQPGTQVFAAFDRTPNRVPATPPRGLSANYLAADSRHGAVVNFRDERDSHGTRVTSRRYADGHVVIETPRVRSER